MKENPPGLTKEEGKRGGNRWWWWWWWWRTDFYPGNHFRIRFFVRKKIEGGGMPELVRGAGSKLPWYLLEIKGPRNSSQPHIVKFAPWNLRLRLWGIKKEKTLPARIWFPVQRCVSLFLFLFSEWGRARDLRRARESNGLDPARSIVSRRRRRQM